MEKKLFYLLDSETGKTIPVEAVREECRAQWKSLCAKKCKGSTRNLIINDKLNIFHCCKCGWQGTLNHLDRTKQPVTEHEASLQPGHVPSANNGGIFKNHWEEYLDLDLFPYPAVKKRPIVKLQDDATGEYIRYSKEDCQRWAEENPNANIWALIGPKNVDLDPDGPKAEGFVQSLDLPDGPIFQSGGKSRHRLFRTSQPLDAITIHFEAKDHLEVRTGNLGVIVPTSIHPVTGRAYQWEPGKSPSEISIPEFPKDAYKKIETLIPAPKMSRPFNGDSKFGRLDLETYLREYGVDWYKVKQRGSRNFFLLRKCLFSSEHGHGDEAGDSAIVQGINDDVLGYHCFHASCFEKTWADARQAISGDDPIYKFCEGYDPNYQGSDRASSNGVRDEPSKRDPIPWPCPLPDLAFYGIAGELAREIEPNSESDPVAILIQCLTVAGNAVGPGPHYRVESDNHQLKLFPVLVGETSKARKGTAWGYIRDTFKQIDESLNFKSGLSSGEGLVWHVRDPITKHVIKKDNGMSQYTDEITDPGVKDKRLLVLEPEFASMLKVMGRDGNILSPVIRQSWDSDLLQGMSKNSPVKATGAHISIIGHITRQELIRYLDRTECGNGFGNRFLYVCVKRSKILPEGGILGFQTACLLNSGAPLNSGR